MNMEKSFLSVVQQSEFKKDATLVQLLYSESEEVEELVDDYGYESILAREHDEELADVLGEELFHELEQRVFLSGGSREQLIAFVNGMGFHLLDWVVVLETEWNIPNEVFTPELIKKMDKRVSRFPQLEANTTVFDLNIMEVAELLDQITDGAIQLK